MAISLRFRLLFSTMGQCGGGRELLFNRAGDVSDWSSPTIGGMKPKAEFEAALQRLPELDDPLSVYDQYYSHLMATEADALTLTQLLEKATQTFVEDRRYRNDPRYLRLWLAYALRCRDPEDIFAFLGMHGIAAELAGYYEEYGAYLERQGDIDKAWGVLKLGVDRQAQPLERLCKRLKEFLTLHPNQPGNKGKKSERPAYRVNMVVLDKGQPELSFEEVRARSWRRAGSILRTCYRPIPQETVPLPSEGNALASDELEAEAALGPLDPDELTHISVYKDNTADLRELARALYPLKSNENVNPANAANLAAPNGHPKLAMDISFDEFLKNEEPLPTRNTRLSLIPEESDGHTQVTGHLRSLLKSHSTPKKETITITDAELRQSQVLDPAKDSVPRIASSSDSVAPRLAAMEKSIGRDGVGNNHTVASLRVASGHYFIERKLGSSTFLGIDLDADLTSSELHQVVLKISPSLWEAFVLGRRVEGIRGVPKLDKTCEHPDGIVFTETFYPHGSLASLLGLSPHHPSPASTVVDEKLILFWLRDVVSIVAQLHSRDILHGRISLDHLLVRLGPVPLNLNYDPNGGGGWADRGVTLVGFSEAIDSARLKAPAGAECYFDSNSMAALAHGGHLRLATLDLRGLLSLLDQLLSGRNQTTLRLADLWREIRGRLEEALDSPLETLASVYEQILLVADERLKVESVTLPTLKSLLTKLEISLLERPTICHT